LHVLDAASDGHHCVVFGQKQPQHNLAEVAISPKKLRAGNAKLVTLTCVPVLLGFATLSFAGLAAFHPVGGD